MIFFSSIVVAVKRNFNVKNDPANFGYVLLLVPPLLYSNGNIGVAVFFAKALK